MSWSLVNVLYIGSLNVPYEIGEGMCFGVHFCEHKLIS